MELSLSGFLFEDNYVSQSVTLVQFCNVARCAGYSRVELRDTQVSFKTPKKERKSALSLIHGTGLTVSCLIARGLPEGGPERDDVFHRYVELCNDMECNLLRISSDTTWLREASAIAEEYGVMLGTNNHINTPLETVAGTRQYFQEINHPNMSLLYDSMHLYISGQDYLGCIPEFIPVTRNILVHSMRRVQPGEPYTVERKRAYWRYALPDDPGVQDWSAVFRAFKKLGYNGLVTVVENGWPVEKREYVATHCAEVIRILTVYKGDVDKKYWENVNDHQGEIP